MFGSRETHLEGAFPVDGGVRERVTTLVATLVEQPEAQEAAAADLMPLVYDELRAIARRYLASEPADPLLQPTVLVHEAYLKLVDQTRVGWTGRSHFRAIGAQAMRRILVDHARARRAQKRGGGRNRVSLSGLAGLGSRRDGLDLEEVLTLEGALQELGEIDARQAEALELRFFGDLPIADIARILGTSKRTVEGDLVHGRAWLRRRLTEKERG